MQISSPKIEKRLIEGESKHFDTFRSARNDASCTEFGKKAFPRLRDPRQCQLTRLRNIGALLAELGNLY